MAYRSSSSTSFAGTSALTATAPAGVVSGDRLLALITDDNAAQTLTPATGWAASIGNADLATPDGQSIEAFEKRNASGSDSYNFVASGTNEAIVQVLAFSGRDTVAPATITVTTNTTANATPIAVSLSGVTALEGDDVAALLAMDQTSSTDVWDSTAPTGYTERQDVGNAAWCVAAVSTRDNVSAGATGALTMTSTRTAGSGTAGYGGFVVAIPAGAPPPPPGPPTGMRGFLPDLRSIGTRALLNPLAW